MRVNLYIQKAAVCPLAGGFINRMESHTFNVNVESVLQRDGGCLIYSLGHSVIYVADAPAGELTCH